MAAKTLGEKEAARYNNGKTLLAANSPLAYFLTALDSTYGVAKYNRDNWRKGMPFSDMMDSLERHYFAFKIGEDIDPESGLPHLVMAAWNMNNLLDYSFSHPEMDDRIKYSPDMMERLKALQRIVNEKVSEYKARATDKKTTKRKARKTSTTRRKKKASQ